MYGPQHTPMYGWYKVTLTKAVRGVGGSSSRVAFATETPPPSPLGDALDNIPVSSSVAPGDAWTHSVDSGRHPTYGDHARHLFLADIEYRKVCVRGRRRFAALSALYGAMSYTIRTSTWRR